MTIGSSLTVAAGASYLFLHLYMHVSIMRVIQNLTISWEINFYDENTC
jgi:hypothetical protein